MFFSRSDALKCYLKLTTMHWRDIDSVNFLQSFLWQLNVCSVWFVSRDFSFALHCHAITYIRYHSNSTNLPAHGLISTALPPFVRRDTTLTPNCDMASTDLVSLYKKVMFYYRAVISYASYQCVLLCMLAESWFDLSAICSPISYPSRDSTWLCHIVTWYPVNLIQ